MGKLLPHVFFVWKNRCVLEGANGITQIKTGKSQVQVGISQVHGAHRKFNPAFASSDQKRLTKVTWSVLPFIRNLD